MSLTLQSAQYTFKASIKTLSQCVISGSFIQILISVSSVSCPRPLVLELCPSKMEIHPSTMASTDLTIGRNLRRLWTGYSTLCLGKKLRPPPVGHSFSWSQQEVVWAFYPDTTYYILFTNVLSFGLWTKPEKLLQTSIARSKYETKL